MLAAAKKSRDSQIMLKAIARAEAQLRLAAEMLGKLRTKVDLVDVRVIRSLNDLTDDELDMVVREAEAIKADQLRAKAELNSTNTQVQ